MKLRTSLLAAGVLVALSTPALAFGCPGVVAEVDEALGSASLSDEQRGQVMELRDQGAALHAEGKHQEALDTLAKAKEALGIG